MSDSQATFANASEIIERFGGIRPMANKLRVPVTTVQGWKKRGVIPMNRKDEIVVAAQANGITIDDLLEKTANENGAADSAPAQTPQADQQSEAEPWSQYEEKQGSSPATAYAAARNEPQTETPRQSAASQLGSQPSSSPQTDKQHEDLLARMQGVEKKAVRQSAWVAAILVLIALGGSAFFLWPTAQKVERHGQQIAALERDVAKMDGRVSDIEQSQSRFFDLFPEGFDFQSLQAQASNLQATVGQLIDTADEVSQAFMSEDGASLSQRVDRIEERLQAFTGSPQLADLMARVDSLKQSADGQELLNQSLSQMQALVTGLEGRVDRIDEALAVAREESDALGQTFEGVSNNDLKAAAMLVALTELRENLNREQEPFADDLALLYNLVDEEDVELRAALDKLAPFAEEGVLSSEGLSREFRGLAGDIVVSSLKGEDVSVQERAKARLNELFQVEQDGELVTGTDTQAKVARAESMLEQGDFMGALGQLRSLEGEAAATATPFIQMLEKKLEVQDARQTINSFVRTLLRPGGNIPNTTKMRGLNTLLPQEPVIRDESSGMTILPKGPSLPGN